MLVLAAVEGQALRSSSAVCAGERARRDLEGSGWVSDEERAEKASAILAGRAAARRTPRGLLAGDKTFCKKAYNAFLAQSNLFRQALDEKPGEGRTLLDIHFDACLKMKELRVSLRDLDAAVRARPASAPAEAEMLAGARQILQESMAAFEEWEDRQSSALREVHERDAREIVRRAGLESETLQRSDHAVDKSMFAHKLLTAEEELALGRKVADGNAAFQELSKFGWKSNAERSELAERIVAGQSAKRSLAVKNLRLVSSVAQKVSRSFPEFDNISLTLEDLVQEGDIGLLEAIERYDASKGFRFATYATWWIRSAMRKAILNGGKQIRVPVGRSEQIRRLKNASRHFELEKGRTATTEELAEILCMSEKTVKGVREMAAKGNTVAELDKVGYGQRESWLSQVSDGADTPLEKLEREDTTTTFTAILTASMQERLTKEEFKAIGMRYGLYGGDKATLSEIADVLCVPKGRVTKLITNGVVKLKRGVDQKKWRVLPGRDTGYDTDFVDTTLFASQVKEKVAELSSTPS